MRLKDNQHLNRQQCNLSYDTISCQGGLLAAILDTKNLLGGARQYGGAPWYEKVIADVAAGYPWVAVACVVDSGTPGTRSFIRYLEALGIHVARWSPLTVCGQKKTADDVLVAVEALKLAHDPRVARIALVTGDSDFRPVVAECRRLRKPVTVAAFASSMSAELRREADTFIPLGASHTVIDVEEAA